MIPSRIFASYQPASSNTTLGELSARLLSEQKKSWPQLATGWSSLFSVQIRNVQCDGYEVTLQFNPGRIVSTGAKVDEKSIRERRCFLCVENLPSEQKGILYRDDYLILCNPAPIFDEHFTVSHRKHVPQSLVDNVGMMLDLAKDLGPRLTVFYNGPRCGASAPDHLHFQASPLGKVPVELAAMEEYRRIQRKSFNGVDVLTLSNYGREVIVLEGVDSGTLKRVLLTLVQALATVMKSVEEPMMNVLCSHDGSSWRIILFPRSKHRPEAYFKEGEERILISPAAVDIGGLIVTPLKKDFSSVDAKTVEGIFSEVSWPASKTDQVIDLLA